MNAPSGEADVQIGVTALMAVVWFNMSALLSGAVAVVSRV